MWFKILVRKTKNNLFLICYDSKGKALTNVSGGMTGAKGSARLSPASAFSAGKLLIEKLTVLDQFKNVLSMDSDAFLYQMACLKKNLKYRIRQRNSSRVLVQGAFLKQSYFSDFFSDRFFFLREFFFLENYPSSPSSGSGGEFTTRRVDRRYKLLFRSGYSKNFVNFREGSFYIPFKHNKNLTFFRFASKRILLKRPSFLLNQFLRVRSLGLLPFRRKLRDSSLALWDVLKERRDKRLHRKWFKRKLNRRRSRRRRRGRSKSFLKLNSLLFLRRPFSSSVKESLVARVLLGSAKSVQLFPFLRTLKFRRSRVLIRNKNHISSKKMLSGNFARVVPLLDISKSLYPRPVAFYSVGFVRRHKKASAFARQSARFFEQKWRRFRFLKRKSFFGVTPPFWRRRFGIKFLLLRKKLPIFHFRQVREGLKPFVFLVASTKMDKNVRAAMRGVITHFPKVLRIFGFFRVPHNGVRAKKQRRL